MISIAKKWRKTSKKKGGTLCVPPFLSVFNGSLIFLGERVGKMRERLAAYDRTTAPSRPIQSAKRGGKGFGVPGFFRRESGKKLPQFFVPALLGDPAVLR